MNHEGIGMGLKICKNLVELNHGTIQVHSRGENMGSTFTFSMQMMAVEAAGAEDCGISTSTVDN